MNAVLDISLVMLFIISVAMGYKKGFVQAVMRVASFIVSLIMAGTFSPPLSEYLYSKYIKPSFVDKIIEDMAAIIGRGVENLNLDKLLTELPTAFVKIIRSHGMNIDEVKALVDESVASGTDNINEFVAGSIVSPLAKDVAYFLSFAAIFFGCMILCRIITTVINNIAKLPVLNFINKTGGILLGVLYGVMWCYVFVFLVSLVMPYFVTIDVIDSVAGVVNNTLLFKWFSEHLPIDINSGGV